MIRKALTTGMYCVIAAIALTGTPTQSQAQDDQPKVEKVETDKPRQNKSGVTPFHGKLKNVDATAKTIVFGETTVQITTDTKIMKAGKPAKLEDAVIGEAVAGAYKKGEDGKLNATAVRFGPKPELAMDSEAKKEKKAKKE